jgi:alpha/beta superfamily hydrolase
MVTKISIKNKEGELLSGILNRNIFSKKLIIICHGSRSTKESPLQKNLAKKLKTYNVFRFDFSGNGESEGKLSESTYSKDIKDILSILEFFKNKYEIKAIIGHSKSGSDVLLASSLLTKHVGKIIALSPRINLLDSQEIQELKKNKISFSEKGFYIFPDSKKQKITKEYISDIFKWKDVSKTFSPKIPTLLIHGDKDKVINFEKSLEFSKRFGVKFQKISGGDHGFTGKYSLVAKIIKRFLKE